MYSEHLPSYSTQRDRLEKKDFQELEFLKRKERSCVVVVGCCSRKHRGTHMRSSLRINECCSLIINTIGVIAKKKLREDTRPEAPD
eukprot:m.164882 g.164882  ORF g.164882 m.164882 type:complete len:86 (-) comp23970_c0_seq4:1175-1432(-)